MIRLGNYNDIEEIMKIVKDIQKEIKNENNPQWNEENDYPSKEKFTNDIENKQLYLYEDSKEIKGFIVISEYDDYEDLLETTNKPSYVLHRLAIKKEYRKCGLATVLFEYAEDLAKKNDIELLKADTEEHNIKMNSLFQKLGFIKKGEFEYDDYPGHYIYYEKEIK